MNEQNTQLSLVGEQLSHMQTGIATIKNDLLKVVEDNKSDLYGIVGEGQALLAIIKEQGISDDLDKKAADYIKQARQVNKTISDRRKPVTQILDLVKKGFTQMEAMLSPKNEDSIVYQLQTVRDLYAQQKLEEQRKIEAERQRQARIKEERERLAQDVRNNCENIYHARLQEAFQGINAAFSLMTLDNAEVVKEKLQTWDTDLRLAESYEKWDFNYWADELSQPDIAKIVQDGIAAVKDELTNAYRDNIRKTCDELLSYYDSKIVELKEQKRLADEARKLQDEKDRAKAEEERKRQEELMRQAEEERQAEAQRKIEDEKARRDEAAVLQKAQREAEALFNQTETVETTKIKAKVTYHLSVDSAEAWNDILTLWITRVAPTLTPEEVTRKLDFMRKDIEKMCNKQSETIAIKGAEWIETVKAK